MKLNSLALNVVERADAIHVIQKLGPYTLYAKYPRMDSLSIFAVDEGLLGW